MVNPKGAPCFRGCPARGIGQGSTLGVGAAPRCAARPLEPQINRDRRLANKPDEEPEPLLWQLLGIAALVWLVLGSLIAWAVYWYW
jgi:hypothetical protein